MLLSINNKSEFKNLISNCPLFQLNLMDKIFKNEGGGGDLMEKGKQGPPPPLLAIESDSNSSSSSRVPPPSLERSSLVHVPMGYTASDGMMKNQLLSLFKQNLASVQSPAAMIDCFIGYTKHGTLPSPNVLPTSMKVS